MKAALALLVAALPLQAQRLDSIDLYFAGVLPADGPGCAVGVRRQGEVVHRAAYGLADLERRVPLSTHSVFYTGSLSKQFTAASIALAARDGKIDVDAPARRWIPEMPPTAGDVTARDLVHHIGGLREKWELLGLAGVPIATTLVTQQMLLDQVSRQRGVLFPVGTRSSYSNTGYDLLATLLQRATGESIRDYSRQRIFAPLGMKATLYADHFGELIPDRALGYSRAGPEWIHAPAMVETVGSGSLHSSVDDLLLWLAAWERNGGPFADSALAAQLVTRGKLRDGTTLDYAWGLGVDVWQGLPRVQHSGSLAGFRTAMWRLPTLEWSAVVLCNFAQANPSEMMASLVRSFGHDSVVATTTLATYPPAESRASPTAVLVHFPDLAGNYRSDELDASWAVTRTDSGYVVRRGSAPEEMVLPIAGESDQVRIAGRTIRVVRGAEGRVGALVVSSGTAAGIELRP
ncbi:MAG TPA: serine hydrolase domain-containing protein [Gemmatimonadales bacterium]|nr:serine hydrolase domain-containing protein [Gemmatimonadales bacterium]